MSPFIDILTSRIRLDSIIAFTGVRVKYNDDGSPAFYYFKAITTAGELDFEFYVRETAIDIRQLTAQMHGRLVRPRWEKVEIFDIPESGEISLSAGIGRSEIIKTEIVPGETKGYQLLVHYKEPHAAYIEGFVPIVEMTESQKKAEMQYWDK